MRQVLLIVDVQSTFSPPDWLVTGIRALTRHVPAVATIELHDEKRTPFYEQLGWCPAAEDKSLVETYASGQHTFLTPTLEAMVST
jgi:nicotinamidase-related amidase